jgi:hypothetical protein
MIRSGLKYELPVLTALYFIFLLIALQFFGWIVDDLYIYFRYVNNILDGNGIVYNPGDRVEGVSGFSWLMALTVFGYLGLPLELTSKISGLTLALVNLFLIFKISLKAGLGKLSYLACILMLFNLPFVLWSISGFEIMFYMFLMLLSFKLIISLNSESRNIPYLSILLFLISVTRPEGILMSLGFLLFVFNFTRDKSTTLKASLIFGVLFCSFLLFRIFYFGDILPNTYYAKIGHNLIGYYEIRSYKNGLFYIIDFFKHNIQFITLLLLLPFTIKHLIRNRIFLFAMTVLLLQFFFIIFAGGDWMVQYRFMIPAIPFLSLVTVICLNEFLVKRKYSAKQAIIVALLFPALATYSFISEDKFIINKETVMWNKLKEHSKDIKLKIPPGSVTANGSSGIIPYYLKDVEFIDVVGLTNKTIAKNGHRQGTWFEKSLPEYVYSKNPEWIIMWKKKNNDGIFTFRDASPCYFDLAENPDFNKYSLHKSYDVYDDVKVELYKKIQSLN